MKLNEKAIQATNERIGSVQFAPIIVGIYFEELEKQGVTLIDVKDAAAWHSNWIPWPTRDLWRQAWINHFGTQG